VELLTPQIILERLARQPLYGSKAIPPLIRPSANKIPFVIQGEANCFEWHYLQAIFHFPTTKEDAYGACLTNDPSSFIIWRPSEHHDLHRVYVFHLSASTVEGAYRLLMCAAKAAVMWNMNMIEYFVSDTSLLVSSAFELPGWSVVQRTDAVASLMIWQDGEVITNPMEHYDWIGNEKYAWA
jgi:hypothetical protein